ncbi:NAD-dependent epimerase/dehydratase family protein [Engelhardtia mirabilis]|uniref:CDP-paratose 2-epimerase n=1 Tax=Engelhardtia mirabilis TaxID=2528011 RepID=A0A518BJW9_9BACT|nr:CDP-paratose 2-epimerase [Planctomycetes bacterium Pla133]QDV01594.1 CDP-paratose 2-epimerase [Planctomycetes bacterium Pla86]
MARTLLVTGSSGLIGSQAVRHFAARGWRTVGVDNHMRAQFFGSGGDPRWNLERLVTEVPDFDHRELDVRDRRGLADLVRELKPAAIVHCAAQPSHDLAASRPFDDFEVNALGTLNLLEAARAGAPGSPFVFLSTNKVYGDAPNEYPLVEQPRRFEFARAEDFQGIDETCRIDRSTHSLFGASKASADLLVQEYGRYFGMPTVCFRGGCLTGPAHSGVELHGFLSWLVDTAVSGRTYTVIGHGGKQVRDQIHSHDVCTAIEAFIEAPRSAEVYNLGGGRESNGSVLECLDLLADLLGREVPHRFERRARVGDHVCYISDTRRFRSHYPHWTLSRRLPEILAEMVDQAGERSRAA